jgi:hypothetical protein
MRVRNALAAALVAAACLTAGCNKVSYVNSGTMPTGQQHQQTGHFFFYGIVGTADVDVGAMCPTGVSSIQSKFTVADWFLAALTLGIYSPRTYEISCGTGGAQ